MFTDYFEIGWEHILAIGAWDHLLFILALAILYTFKEWRQVLILVTAFTIGHSLTLILSALNILSYSGKWIEFLIPCTIILTGLGNTMIKKYTSKNIRINYYLALFFGLIHGMGFASGLKSLLGKESNILIPLLGFNLGIEAAQILVVSSILLFSFLILSILKLNRRDYVLFISGGATLAAIIMALERLPF